MSKRNKDIKMTIFIMVVGIGLTAGNIKTQPIYGKFLLSLLTFQPKTIRMIPVMFVIQHINLKFHMLLTEKPIRENMKNASGQVRAATQKNIPMIN